MSNGDPLQVNLPIETVEAIAARAAELVVERIGETNGSPWLTRREAAAYLHLPLSRLERDKTIPAHRHGARVLYHRAELDRFLLGEGVE
jgi:excisionase family DNA binding protein